MNSEQHYMRENEFQAVGSHWDYQLQSQGEENPREKSPERTNDDNMPSAQSRSSVTLVVLLSHLWRRLLSF